MKRPGLGEAGSIIDDFGQPFWWAATKGFIMTDQVLRTLDKADKLG